MAANRFKKDPEAILVFGIDWVNLVPAGGSLSGVTWEVPSGITQAGASVTGTTGLIKLSGGTSGATYEVVGVATFSDGQVDVRRLKISVAPQ
jgi:hypothetical protein